MTRPADSPGGQRRHTVMGSTIKGGPGPTAGVMGDVSIHHGDVYGETTNFFVVNNISYPRATTEETCDLLETDGPRRALELLRKQEDGGYRRLLLRKLSPQKSVAIIEVMAAQPDGHLECANHLGPMDAEHALPLLRALDPVIQANIVAWMDRDDAARLLAALATDPQGAVEVAHLIGRIAASQAGHLAGPQGAAAILPLRPEVLAHLQFEPATALMLCALGQRVLPVLDAIGSEAAGRHLSEMAAQRPGETAALLDSDDSVARMAPWLNETSTDVLLALFARMDASAITRVLNALRAGRAAAVLTRLPAGRCLELMNRTRAAAALDTLAASDPSAAGNLLRHCHPTAGAELIARMGTAPDRRPALLRQVPPAVLLVLLAELNRAEPELAKSLLLSGPRTRSYLGTWPFWAATKTSANMAPHYFQLGQADEQQPLPETLRLLLRTWWNVRLATGMWTEELGPRRRRDAISAAVGAAIAVTTTLVITASTRPDLPAAVASTAATPSPLAGSAKAATAPTGVPRFPSDLPLTSNRASWTTGECPGWTEETAIRTDPVERVTMLRLVCTLRQNAPASQVAYLQYPPDAVPYSNRPTEQYPIPSGSPGATVYRIVTPDGRQREQNPTWSRADGRHGQYMEYLPDKHKSAIWLEEEGLPAQALVLFGPDPDGMSEAELAALFAQLRGVLSRHGYILAT